MKFLQRSQLIAKSSTGEVVNHKNKWGWDGEVVTVETQWCVKSHFHLQGRPIKSGLFQVLFPGLVEPFRL